VVQKVYVGGTKKTHKKVTEKARKGGHVSRLGGETGAVSKSPTDKDRNGSGRVSLD